MVIKRIINKQFNTNTYLIKTDENSSSVIVIDPGENCVETIIAIAGKDAENVFILLSHEHFDHITGVNAIREKFSNCILVASEKCGERITDPKKNFSHYANRPISCNPPEFIIKTPGQIENFCGLPIQFYPWEGHSPGGMLIKIEDSVLTGDQIIKDKKTITNLPDCNRQKVEECVAFMRNNFAPETILMPGHGDSLRLKDLNIY